MSQAIKIGIVGAGVFGNYHAQKYATLAEAALVGVFDPDEAAAKDIAERYDARSYSDSAVLFDQVDAVVIASPATTHFESAKRALQSGLSVFVEKPLACDLDEALWLASYANENGQILQVGHQERYVLEALGLFSQPKLPKKIICKRTSKPSERCKDVSVVMDLMIHDLDIISKLSDGASVRVLSAKGNWDNVATQFDLSNDIKVEVTAIRNGDDFNRTLELHYDNGVVCYDFGTRQVDNSAKLSLNMDILEDLDSMLIRDPLGFGAESFLSCIRHQAPPSVSGHDGVQAVRLGCAIEAAAGIVAQ